MPRSPQAVDRRLRAVEYRRDGLSYPAIGAKMQISDERARVLVQEGLALVATEAVTDLRTIENQRLDDLQEASLEVLRRNHIVIQQGKIVGKYAGIARDDAGEPVRNPDGSVIPLFEEVLDDAPVLQAIDRLIRISERRAKLNGLDAPVKIEMTDEHELDEQISTGIDELVSAIRESNPLGQQQQQGATG